ncbi:histidine kinase [Xylariales sp. AK1849]|nr:histidine kinase [Xylariales sp. AK1849]
MSDDGAESRRSDAQDDLVDFSCPLPPADECVLGPSTDWPASLKALSLTIAAFAYPAALFWGEELVLLYNSSWAEVGGQDEQGKKQRGRLSANAWGVLDSCYHGGKPKRIEAHELLRSNARHSKNTEDYTVLISPFHDNEEVAGLVAQLLPKRQSQASHRKSSAKKGPAEPPLHDQAKSTIHHELDISQLGKVSDDVPLDKHPFFHRFAEMLPTGLAILDHRAQAIFVNQHFYTLTTHRGEDQSFQSWPQSIHSEDYDRVMDAYKEAFHSQTQLRTEFRAMGDRDRWRLLLLTPLGDDNLQHVSLREYGGFICSVVDISSEKSAELAGLKAAEEAQKRKEQQERFFDMISHEIRNPLSALLHCTEEVEDAIKAPAGSIDISAVREAIETMNLCILQQRQIVDDVLSFSKLQSSMLSLVMRPCRPAQQLADLLKMFRPEFRKKSMQFSYHIDRSYAELDVTWVMADLARMGQVLVNLVTNAIKFTAYSDDEKKITISTGVSRERPKSYPESSVFYNADVGAYRNEDTDTTDGVNGETLFVMVAVEDTGIGINKEGQKRLFERFRQATPETSEIYGGSGLGLNISRKLCQLHDGDIGVASEEGSGSTFGFFFKVKRSVAPAESSGRRLGDMSEPPKLKQHVVDQDNASPVVVNSEQPSKPIESEYIHVLLVDDNGINQDIILRKLEAKGFKVTTAKNGREAVDAVKNASKAPTGSKAAFSVILMDQNMPVLCGTSATREIRSLEAMDKSKHIPILGVTADSRGAQ